MKVVYSLFLLVAMAGAAVAQAPDLTRMDVVERSVPDGPVALVDGQSISKERFLTMYRDQLGKAMQAEQAKTLEDSTRVKAGLRTLADLIRWEILYQEGLRRKIQVPEAEVDAAYADEIRQLQQRVAGRGSAAPSEEDILRTSGQTRESARADLRKSILIRKTREALIKGKEAPVSDAEIAKFYQERPQSFQRGGTVHLRQIFVRPKPNAREATEEQWAAAEQKVREGLSRIQAGDSFEAAARAVSEGADREKGGDMGAVPITKLPPFFAERAQKMKPSEISDVFRSEHGVHLIQLVERHAEGTVPLEEAKPKIKQLLQQVKSESVVDEFCHPIVSDPERVRVFIELERTLAALGANTSGQPKTQAQAQAEPKKQR